MPLLNLRLSRTGEAAGFIAAQISSSHRVPSESAPACLAVLGLAGCAPRAEDPLAAMGIDGHGLCALLLQRGAQLVVLDRPRNRLMIETLLPLAADPNGQWRGSCRLERDVSSVCRDADGVLLLPGWGVERRLAWGVLAERLRPGAQVFDLRPDSRCEGMAAPGLRIWQMGRLAAAIGT